MPFSKAYRRYAFTLLLVSTVSVSVKCLSPIMQRRLIDGAIGHDGRLALLAGCLIGIIMLADFGLGILLRWIDGLMTIQVRKNLKGGIFKHLLALPEEFLKSKGAGYFFNRVQSDANEVCLFLRGNGVFIWTDILKLFIALLAIANVQWRCALLALPFLLIQAIVCGMFRKRQFALSSEIQECIASERHIMQEYLSKHSVIKTHSAAEAAGERVDNGMKRWGGLFRSRLSNENWFRATLQVPIWCCKGLVAFIGFYKITKGTMSIGELWEIIGLLSLLFVPARTLGYVYVQMQSALSAWKRLDELWNESREDTGAGAKSSGELRLHGDIHFDDISFSYSGKEPLLENVSLSVMEKSIVFVTGPNGCGKSTLLSLFLRLYHPLSGDITIGGRSIFSAPLKEYRSRIGYIGQNPEFIKGTLRENLLLGNGGHTDDEILDAARTVGCEELVMQRGLDSLVNENADNFSGGERLRLALVRELLRDTDILLFDEPAAHLDVANRQAFYELLLNMHRSKTIIAVVHNIPDNVAAPVFRLHCDS